MSLNFNNLRYHTESFLQLNSFGTTQEIGHIHSMSQHDYTQIKPTVLTLYSIGHSVVRNATGSSPNLPETLYQHLLKSVHYSYTPSSA